MTASAFASDTTTFDVIILGAGITGLSAAYFLAKEGKSVKVIDTFPSPGGNHISRRIGPFTFDIGAIFFWSDNPQFEMFDGLLETCIPLEFSALKLSPSQRITQYPYSLKDEFLSQSLKSQAASMMSLARARLIRGDIRSAADFAIRQIGPKIYEESGLRLYLDRFYGISGERVSPVFAKRRMLWIQQHASVANIARRFALKPLKELFVKPPKKLQALARPREGFERYYGVIETRLREMGVDFEFSAAIASVKRDDRGLHVVATEKVEVASARLINTMPITIISDLEKLELGGLDLLKSLDMTTLFCSTPGEPNFDSIVLYNFNSEGAWKRLTLHSAYYGKAEGRHYFAVECTHLGANPGADELFADFDKHARSAKLFSEPIRLEGSHLVEHAYPVYEHGFDAILNKAFAALEGRGVESLGRQGRFDYIPASTLAIEMVRDALT